MQTASLTARSPPLPSAAVPNVIVLHLQNTGVLVVTALKSNNSLSCSLFCYMGLTFNSYILPFQSQSFRFKRGCTFISNPSWLFHGAKPQLLFMTLSCCPPIQYHLRSSYLLPSSASSTRYSLGPSHPSFCVLMRRKYFPEDLASLMLVSS